MNVSVCVRVATFNLGYSYLRFPQYCEYPVFIFADKDPIEPVNCDGAMF